jgi:hypothetical protein
MTNALQNIEKLVHQVAEMAISDAIPLNEKLDALKLLTPYYAVLKKAKARPDDESDDEPTMGDMRERLRVVEEPADGGVETASRRSRTRS